MVLVGMKSSVIRDLENDPNNTYYLTGSKYFGSECEFSDTDFFVTNGPTVREYLIKHGFVSITETSYVDSSVIDVFRHEGDNVDVQIVRDAIVKQRAQELLKHLRILHPSKSTWESVIFWIMDSK